MLNKVKLKVLRKKNIKILKNKRVKKIILQDNVAKVHLENKLKINCKKIFFTNLL